VPSLDEAESYRRELVAYCYRYFACYSEAEDAVQETMLRAWQRAAEFEGRASLRTWLYTIATNICLDMKRAPQRRSRPMDLSSPGHTPDAPTALVTRPESTWVGIIADSHLPRTADPAEAAELRESVRLAFVAALQLLPPRQRDVLAWTTQECAELLDTTVASANSALARARKTMAAHDPTAAGTREYDEQLLMNYVAAFEAYDVDRLVALLAEDAVFSMPPFELWLHGAAEIERWWRGPGEVCRNARTIMSSANGQPAVAVYHDAGGGSWQPFAIHVVDAVDGRIASITQFMGAGVFAELGLPSHFAGVVSYAR
jgi:RNA polymerase sigma-70 factor (ECF subfamily)